jgi:hypothetical protein
MDEDSAVAAVEGARAAAVGARVGEVGHRRGGGEAGGGVLVEDLEPVEEAEERRGSVVGAVAAEEGGVADDSEPRFADQGGAEEVLGLVRWETEEDFGGDVVDQLRRRRRRRRHDVLDFSSPVAVVRLGGLWALWAVVGLGGSTREERNFFYILLKTTVQKYTTV